MNAALAPLNDFWKQRNARERTILLVAGGFLLTVLVYVLLIEPLARERSRLERSLPNLRSEAARFQRDLAQLKDQAPGQAIGNDLTALAMAAGIPRAAAKIEASGDKRSALHVKAIDWPVVTALLASSQAHGWTLSKLAVRSPDGGTMIDADLEWTR